MFSVRSFKNPFAGRLFAIAEDDTTGFYATHLRMQIFLNDLHGKIEETNRLTLEEFERDPDAAGHMSGQPDIDAQLYHFSDILCKGLIVSIYSYMEVKVCEIETLYKKEGPCSKTFKPNGKHGFGDSTLFKSISKIFNDVLEEDLIESSANQKLEQLAEWVPLRNGIVHDKRKVLKLTSEFRCQNGISIKHGEVFLSDLTVKNFNNLVYDVLSDMVDRIADKHDLVSRG